MSTRTLILNADWRPLTVIDGKRAIVLEMTNKHITVVSYYDKVMRSPSIELPIPAVIAYQRYVNINKMHAPTRKNIRFRDKSTCAYCGTWLSPNDFTIDHITPVCRFPNKNAANTWDNMIGCCTPCNSKKGNKTPKEAGMKLLFQPRKVENVFTLQDIPPEWADYIS